MEEDIGSLIKQIHNNFDNLFNKGMEKFEITHSQLDILIYLIRNQEKEINQKDIEEKFNLTNPTVTGLLNRLENKGFIIRTTSTKDARYKKITVTDKTLNLCNTMHEKADKMTKKITENISKEEAEITKRVLKKVLTNIKDIQERKMEND